MTKINEDINRINSTDWTEHCIKDLDILYPDMRFRINKITFKYSEAEILTHILRHIESEYNFNHKEYENKCSNMLELIERDPNTCFEKAKEDIIKGILTLYYMKNKT